MSIFTGYFCNINVTINDTYFRIITFLVLLINQFPSYNILSFSGVGFMRRRMSIWIPLFGSLALIALFTVLLVSLSADTAVQQSKLEDAQKRLAALELEQTELKTTLENADSDSFIENRTH